MQILQAGSRKLLYLELEREVVEEIVQQLGMQARIDDDKRALTIEVEAGDRQAPLLLFDAADPGNLGWFARCQFYADGQTGAVLQTPLSVANRRDRKGNLLPNALRVRVSKELPASFRLAGKNTVDEQNVYAILYNFLNALLNTGVGVCGSGVVRPVAGRGGSKGHP